MSSSSSNGDNVVSLNEYKYKKAVEHELTEFLGEDAAMLESAQAYQILLESKEGIENVLLAVTDLVSHTTFSKCEIEDILCEMADMTHVELDTRVAKVFKCRVDAKYFQGRFIYEYGEWCKVHDFARWTNLIDQYGAEYMEMLVRVFGCTPEQITIE